jgi:uncharacterized membrane protein
LTTTTTTKKWAIAIILTGTLLNSIAQVLYKFGAERLTLSISSLLTNYFLMIGLSIYAVSAIALLIALKGGELSVLYPLIATSYVWVSFLSIYFFNEIMNVYKWLGIIVIILGVTFIGMGSRS